MNINKNILGIVFDNLELLNLLDKKPKTINKLLLKIICDYYILKRNQFKTVTSKKFKNLHFVLSLRNGGICTVSNKNIFILDSSFNYIRDIKFTSPIKFLHELTNENLILSSQSETIVQINNGKENYQLIQKLKNNSICCSIAQLDSARIALALENCTINIFDNMENGFELIKTINQSWKVTSMIVLIII
jgi:hypothetical protein